MKKRITILVVLMLMLSSINGFASSNGISVLIEDDDLDKYPISFDTAPVIENGRVLVPMRAIFEEFGYYVEWIPKDQAIRAVKSNGDFMTGIVLWINDCEARENNYIWDYDLGDYRDAGSFNLYMDVPPRIINGRTMVPLRFISETFGCYVTWDNNTKTVVISPYTPDDTTHDEALSDRGNLSISDEQKAINDQYVELFDESVDTTPGAFQ